LPLAGLSALGLSSKRGDGSQGAMAHPGARPNEWKMRWFFAHCDVFGREPIGSQADKQRRQTGKADLHRCCHCLI
jgi:hypothetical protein